METPENTSTRDIECDGDVTQRKKRNEEVQTVAEKQELASKEGITPEEEPKKKMEDTTLEEGAGGWLGCEELERVLKANQCKPCKVSLGLSVTDSLSTRTKIKHLVQLLSSVLSPQAGGAGVGVCLVGLHCCGSLANTIIKIFSEKLHTEIRCLMLLGCCYHKIGDAEWMPMSQVLQEVSSRQLDVGASKETGTCCLLTTYGLRLAAQETKDRWQVQSAASHERHERCVAHRGMLQAVLHEAAGNTSPHNEEESSREGSCGHGIEVMVPSRIRGLKSDCLENYAKAAALSMQDASIYGRLMDYHAAHRQYLSYIQPFTALQVCMQGVLEAIVLKDQQQYLLERETDVQLIPVFSPHISPRNIAIVASSSS